MIRGSGDVMIVEFGGKAGDPDHIGNTTELSWTVKKSAGVTDMRMPLMECTNLITSGEGKPVAETIKKGSGY